MRPFQPSGSPPGVAASKDLPFSSTRIYPRLAETRAGTFFPSLRAPGIDQVEPGGMRELHWHPNTDEWQYYIEGQGRMGVFATAGQARTFDFMAGDVGYVPFAMGH